MNITIVDYNVGNIRSIVNMLILFKNIKIKISSNRKEILKSDKVILPGVGAFGNAMNKINKLELKESINQYIKTGNSILGICLGMQLFMESSNEFSLNKGLGLIPGKVERIPLETSKILPNIGYFKLKFKKQNINPKIVNSWYYFIHSYHCVPFNPSHINSEIIINSNKIVSSISKDNIHGCQFHPEKSSEGGIEFFKLFLNE